MATNTIHLTALALVTTTVYQAACSAIAEGEAMSAAVKAGASLDDVRVAFIRGHVAAHLPGAEAVALKAAETLLAKPEAKKNPLVNNARSACSYRLKQVGLSDNSKGAGRKPRTPSSAVTPASVAAGAAKVIANAASVAKAIEIVPDAAIAALKPLNASSPEQRKFWRRLASIVANAEKLVGADHRAQDVLRMMREMAREPIPAAKDTVPSIEAIMAARAGSNGEVSRPN